jgi:hypothetical protein
MECPKFAFIFYSSFKDESLQSLQSLQEKYSQLTKTLFVEKQTPLPKIEKHDLTIGAFWQGKRLRMDITCMTIKLLFWH